MSDITSYIDWKKKREIINTEGLDTLKDDTVKGVLRSIGDAGDNPINATGETVLSRLKGINDNLTTRASEATLSSVDSRLGSVDTKLGSIDSKLDNVDTKLGGIDTRLSSVDTRLGSIDTKLDTNLSTRASEATLSSVDTKLDNVDTKLGSIDTKLGSLDTKLDNVDTKLDTNLSTRASEATLSSVDSKLSSVDTRLGSIDTRLSSVNTKLGNVDSKLGSVNSKLDIQLSSLQRPDLFTKEINVGTTAVQVDTSTDYRKEVILLAKKTNTDDVLVGTSTAQVFPLEPGAAVGIMGTSLNKIYLRAVSGTQKVYVLAGGS